MRVYFLKCKPDNSALVWRPTSYFVCDDLLKQRCCRKRRKPDLSIVRIAFDHHSCVLCSGMFYIHSKFSTKMWGMQSSMARNKHKKHSLRGVRILSVRYPEVLCSKCFNLSSSASVSASPHFKTFSWRPVVSRIHYIFPQPMPWKFNAHWV